MIRLLVIAALVFVFLYGLRALALRAIEHFRVLLGEPPRPARGRGAARPPGGSPARPQPPPAQVGELAPCSECGVHVLASRLIGDGRGRYCSEACREKAAARAR